MKKHLLKIFTLILILEVIFFFIQGYKFLNILNEYNDIIYNIKSLYFCDYNCQQKKRLKNCFYNITHLKTITNVTSFNEWTNKYLGFESCVNTQTKLKVEKSFKSNGILFRYPVNNTLNRQINFIEKNLMVFKKERDWSMKKYSMLAKIDSLILYCMVRYFKPRTLIEIGSGYSTYEISKARLKNENEGFIMDLNSIEPYRSNVFNEIYDINIYKKRLEQMDINIFKILKEGDILFIDSSHINKHFGDCYIEFLFILPILKKGVIIHVHNVYYPITRNDRYNKKGYNDYCWYSEVNYLALMLLDNEYFELIISLPEIYFRSNYFKRNRLKFGESIWFKKIK
jgi:hypothetical protein